MADPRKFGRNFRISISDGREFTPIGHFGAWNTDPVEMPVYTLLSHAEPVRIVCEPIPGPNGTIRYVQDWSDLTHFG